MNLTIFLEELLSFLKMAVTIFLVALFVCAVYAVYAGDLSLPDLVSIHIDEINCCNVYK